MSKISEILGLFFNQETRTPKRNKAFKKYKTVLGGNTAKGRQEILQNLLQFHDPIKIYPDLRGGTLILLVGKNPSQIAGTIDSKITRELECKIENYKLEVGDSYKITKGSNNLLSCSVEISVFMK